MADLKESGLLKDPDAVMLQSFLLDSLEKMRDLLKAEKVNLPMTWLLECTEEIPSEEALKMFSTYGTAIG